MSYDIIYNRQFIKVDDNHVIPFLEMGSSNVTEGYGRNERRARDWGNSYAFTEGKNIIVANNILIENLNKFEENFDYTSIVFYGRSSKRTTFNAFKAYYRNAISQAMTIEELLENGIEISIKLYRYRDEDILTKGFEIKPDVTFQSTRHMIETISEFENYYGNNFHLFLYCHDGFTIEEMKKRQNKNKRTQRKEKSLIQVQEFYVLRNDEGGYFVKNTAKGYKYSFFINSNIKSFMTLEEAQKFHNKMKYNCLFTIEKKEFARNFYV